MTTAGALFVPSLLKAEWFHPNALQVFVDANAKGEKLDHFWSKCVGAGRANEGLRATWLEHLKLSKEHCGFQYCRFHGLFHDDMFVYHEANGKTIYNWQYIDDLFDRMLAVGVRPFVELGFTPTAMASDLTAKQFWWEGNVSPPQDFKKWADLVTAFTRHCISRYGIEEVRQWYFEVWNEPNLWGFWHGTKSQYFELYKVSANAIKAIDKSLRVGGPSTSNFVPDDRFAGEKEDKTKHKTLTATDINALDWEGVWIKDFLAYCKNEKLPIDFISCHPYPTDWALDPTTGKGGGRVREVNATKKDLQWLQKTIKESAYLHAELHCTEWSSSPSSRDPQHDSLSAATYLVKANLDGIGLANSLSYWVFTDLFEEKGAGNSVFHGGFGLINYQGIVKPTFHAYKMLNQLGDEILQREEGLIVTRQSKNGKITALLYHYPEERKNVVEGGTEALLSVGKPRKFSLNVKALKATSNFIVETLDKNSGYAYGKWKAMGSPEPPTKRQTKELKDFAMVLKTERARADAKGNLKWEKNLQPWTCVLIKEV